MYTPTYEETIEHIDSILETLAIDGKTEEDLQKYHTTLYNESIYALSHKDHKLAFKCLTQLKQDNIAFEYQDMMFALILDYRGKPENAIDLMIRLLGKDRHNRFYNINLGLMYKNSGNKLLSYKYLAIGAALLEKSEGLYKTSDLFNIAVDRFNAGSRKKALGLFKIVVSEQNNVDAWAYIGDIFMQMRNYNGAIKSFKEIISINPESKLGHSKLKMVHDMFFNRGLKALKNQNPRIAIKHFHRALNAITEKKTYQKAIETYTQLHDLEPAQELQRELDKIKQRESDVKMEHFRRELIGSGKQLLKEHQFNEATLRFEKAFKMKVDKDVFMYLAFIYKNMGKTKKLAGLMRRWEALLELEEKTRQRARSIERSSRA